MSLKASEVDRRGVLSFLGITFGLTYAIEAGLIVLGVRFSDT